MDIVVSVLFFFLRLVGVVQNFPKADKETILLVHGTFAAPKPGITQWYQPGSTFCQTLDAAMERHGSKARCWQHLSPGEVIYSWDGENSWHSRLIAAKALSKEVLRLAALGWRCHIITHSHGGNVALEAYRLFGMKKVDNLIVLMGCPIINYKDRPLRFAAVVSAVFMALLFFYFFPSGAKFFVDSIRAHRIFTTIAIVIVLLCLGGFPSRSGLLSYTILGYRSQTDRWESSLLTRKCSIFIIDSTKRRLF